jgi:uncharacterized DUF497 family protein
MLRFAWDNDKAAANRLKHGVDFNEAATVFGDALSLTIEDRAHSKPGDERFVTIGQSYAGRILVIVHADEGDLVRIISARSATKREREQYESGP